MARNAAKAVEISDRRRKVAGLYLRRCTQEEIAAQLKVSQATVSSDLKALRLAWEAAAQADIAQLQAEALARLVDMDRDCATRFAQDHDLGFMKERGAIHDRIAKLLGLNAPEKRDVTSGGMSIGGPVVLVDLLMLPEEEIDQRIARAEGDQATEGLSG